MNKADDFISLATSIPSLKNKIHVNINKPTDKIFWYIKFNITLDEESVSNKTMNVTDTKGYILNTAITYQKSTNMIEINPLEDYVQNEYYILSISKKISSEKHQKLKKDIHILFKLKDNVISEYKVLPPNVKVPKPKKKVYSFEKYVNTESSDAALPYADIMINPFIGIIGLVLTIASFFMKNVIIILFCAVIVLIGFGHIILQLTNKKFRSNFFYNRGVKHFKKENYFKADVLFDKAIKINPENEYAEFAKNKNSFFLQ